MKSKAKKWLSVLLAMAILLSNFNTSVVQAQEYEPETTVEFTEESTEAESEQESSEAEHVQESSEVESEAVTEDPQDLNLEDVQELFAWIDTLPATVEEFAALSQEWWDSLLPNEYLTAETQYRFLLSSNNGNAHTEIDESIEAYIARLEAGESAEEMFYGTAFEGLDLETLKEFQAEGYTMEDLIEMASSISMFAGDKAYLSTVWESFGNGRINRKYLDGGDAFCFNEDKKFPNGASYSMVTAQEAGFTGRAAYIVQFYGQSGETNSHWWNECQVAIWAVQAGCDTYDQGAAYAAAYCRERGITDSWYVADYKDIVGKLVEQSRGQNGSCYVYKADDPANQDIATYAPVWAPAPEPEPEYASVSASAERTATVTHKISIDKKYANITGESLAGVVFEVYEDGVLKGTITTDTSGKGSLSWTVSATKSSTKSNSYCSNYDELFNDQKAEVTGYTSRDAAYNAALSAAQTEAQNLANAEASKNRTVKIVEKSAPAGFTVTNSSTQTVTLNGTTTSKSVSVPNNPWKAKLVIDKVDGDTGKRIDAETVFAIYEWNGSAYVISSNYSIIRLSDGTYTVKGNYSGAEQGYLYYTKTNSGKFALQEVTAPDKYYLDSEMVYFQITADGQTFYGHNADPSKYPINDNTKFANEMRTQPEYAKVSATAEKSASRTHEVKVDKKYADVTDESLAGAVFEVYEDRVLKGTITTDANGKGSLSWQISKTVSVTIEKSYCTNYDSLDAEEKALVTGYKTKAEAEAAAQAEANAQAQAQADADVDASRSITIKEITVPDGFFVTSDSEQSATLAGNDSHTFDVSNKPMKAKLVIDKVDGITGERINADASFVIYEWNGSAYVVSTNYTVIRLADGTYTVDSGYEDGEQGYLYYTQANKGKFGLAETAAPDEYYLDGEVWYFEIEKDDQTIYGHNADPSKYPINDTTKFANEMVPQPEYAQVSATITKDASRTHKISVEDKYALIIGEKLAGAVFEVYEDGKLVGTITTDTNGTGNCEWEIYETASATYTKTYCSNYDELEDEEKGEVAAVTVYTNREAALAAAEADAAVDAQAKADAAADLERTVTIKEVATPEGFITTSDSEQSDILAGNDSHVFSVSNMPMKGRLVIDKVDGDTGSRIDAATVFALYEWNGSVYVVSSNYSIIRLADGTYTVNSVYTDGEQGYLYYTQANEGKYGLAEISAPNGYVLDDDIFYFQITSDGDTIYGHNAMPEDYEINDPTKFVNAPVVGNIYITKEGEFVVEAQKTFIDEIKDFFMTIFTYITGRVVNAQFEVYVRDTIYTSDGTGAVATYGNLLLEKDVLVATITTDSTGIARLENLPLGGYYVKEVGAGDGDFLLNETIADIVLEYKGQEVAVVVDNTIKYVNDRQKVQLTVTKKSHYDDEYAHLNTGETAPENSEDVKLSGAIFALYNAEPIVGYEVDPNTGAVSEKADSLLPADTLIEKIVTGSDGSVTFTSDLPCGKYYIKEVQAPDGYFLSEEVYEFDASYTDQDGDDVIVLAYDYYNKPVVVGFSKQDIVDGKEIPGCLIKVTLEDGTLIDQWTSDGSVHYIKHMVLDQTYIMTELNPADGYVTADSIKFTVTQATDPDGKMLPEVKIQIGDQDLPSNVIVMKDERTKLEVLKIDEVTGELVPGATLQLLDEDGKEVCRWITDGTSHMIECLPFGTYTLVEIEVPEGYYKADPITFKIEDTAEVHVVEMIDKMIVDIDVVKTTIKVTQPGNVYRYDVSVIANNSVNYVENFTLEDVLPEDVDIQVLHTGIYNAELNYRVLYYSSVNGWQVWAEDLNSLEHNILEVSSLSLAEGERITAFKVEYGTVPRKFGLVENSVMSYMVKVQNDAVGILHNDIKLTADSLGITYEVSDDTDTEVWRRHITGYDPEGTKTPGYELVEGDTSGARESERYPVTGDTNNLLLPAISSLAAMIAIVFIVSRKRKEQDI